MNSTHLPVRTFLALFSGAYLTLAQAAPQMPSREAPQREMAIATFRAPDLASSLSVAFSTPLPKLAAADAGKGGKLRVGSVRSLAKAAPVQSWTMLPGGYVMRMDAGSSGAEGMRVRLDVAALTAPLEVRAQGSDGRIEVMTVEPGRAPVAWTPWTEGSTQSVELYSRAPQEVSVGAVVHTTVSPYAKAAGSCTIAVHCTANDAALDAAIVQRKKSVMRISFVEDGGSYVCTATLINTEKFPAGYLLTANHCISEASAAASVTSTWFYENSTCDVSSGAAPGQVQVAGGTQLVFGNYMVDASLLLMNGNPPAAAMYSGWSAARVSNGTAVTSLSHPAGDTMRLAVGSTSQELRIFGHPYDMYGVRFTRGIIEGGSSGSGLFTMSNGSLVLRGVLSGSTVRNGGMSCSNTNEDALYGRFEVIHPQIEQYIRTAAQAADDAPNRPQDLFNVPIDANGADMALDLRTSPIAFDGRRIDYPGDYDTYRFVLSAPAVVSAWTEGPNIDTVGAILDSRGVDIENEDDAQVNDNHFGITRRLEPGVYYVHVGHWDPAGTGSYNLRIRADSVDAANHTSLWWNSAESGWGLNVNHQGNKIFATLFTYDASGPMWLVMSDGNRQPDGTYSGTLYRTTGPAFNANPFGSVTVTSVGTMRLSFQGTNAASLTYTVNGVEVSKSLSRQEFGSVPTCTWSAFDRSYTDNLQDLWSNPAEPGWGVNLAHQGNTLFATLFTYDSTGKGVWLVMSNGTANTSGGFSGPLYRIAGPVFNASPWTAVTPTQVGTMTFTPTTGNAATLAYTFSGVTVTKQVQRQVFGPIKPSCD